MVIKNSPVIVSFFIIAVACSEEKQSSNKPNIQKSLASYEVKKEDENPIISVEPSENVTLDDYWEEAISIQAEAEQILESASQPNCMSAKEFAKNAISLSQQTSDCKNLTQAEHLIGEAGDMLQRAETYLVSCQEQGN